MKKRPRRGKLSRKALFSTLATLLLSLYFLIVDIADNVALPSDATPIQFYSSEVDGDLTSPYCTAIAQAQESIILIIYTLNDSQIIDALNKKSRMGCSVKVICDAKTSLNLEKVLDGDITILKRFTAGLMHQKLLLCDDDTAFIGSANMTRASLRHHNNLVTAIKSRALGALIKLKAESFSPSDRLFDFPHQTFHLAGQRLELSFLPDDEIALERLKALMRTASKTVRIAMFTWTDRELASEAIAAKKRGVDVAAIIDSSSAAGASAKVVKMLKRAGVKVKVSGGNALLHHKFMYIDESTLVNGSANWTAAAFKKNDDCFFILHSLDGGQVNYMNRLWKLLSRGRR